MMQLWSPEHIRFMEDAAAYGTFHKKLLQNFYGISYYHILVFENVFSFYAYILRILQRFGL